LLTQHLVLFYCVVFFYIDFYQFGIDCCNDRLGSIDGSQSRLRCNNIRIFDKPAYYSDNQQEEEKADRSRPYKNKELIKKNEEVRRLVRMNKTIKTLYGIQPFAQSGSGK